MLVRKLIPAVLGVWLGFSAAGRGQEGPAAVSQNPTAAPNREPGKLPLVPHQIPDAAAPTLNQRMADAIAERLQLSGRLRGYHVEIRFSNGLVELSGCVADATQREEVVRIVQELPGVDRVRDMLEAGNSGVLLTAQGPKVEQGPEPFKFEEKFDKKPVYEDRNQQAPQPGSMPQEPMSILPHTPGFFPAMPSPAMQQPPPMPPYAWPTYAPYNNYSRVAHPTLYPYEAFPFIGPMHPFPKVPLGWRGISLRWQDGHWWYGREATGHDWWRIRYW